MTLSPFSTSLAPTHTGYDASKGRRVSLVRDTDGAYLTRTEYKARQSGFTREEGTYTDVRPIG